MDSFLKIFRIQLFSNVLYVGMPIYAALKFDICDIYFTQNLFIFFVNSIRYDYLITAETIIWLYSYVKEIYVLYLKKFVLLLSHFLVISIVNIGKVVSMLFSQRFEATPMNKLNFHFQPNIKVEATLIYRRWINVILWMLFQRR